MKRMKQFLAIMCVAALTMSACGNTADTNSSTLTSENVVSLSNREAFSSIDDVTLDEIVKASTPSEIMKYDKAFSVSSTYTGTGDSLFEGAVIKTTYEKQGENVYGVNDIYTYSDGYVSNSYYSNDPSDKNYYILDPSGKQVAKLDDGYADEMVNMPILQFTEDSASIKSVTEENGKYIATVSTSDGATEVITLDKATKRIESAIATYASVKSDEMTTCERVFDYSENVKMDYSAKTENGGDAPNVSAASSDSKKISLEATDINGNVIPKETYENAKLVMLNFWEPWCGPCVGEMPDLEKLYEAYKDKGLVILGAYSTFDMDDDAKSIVSEKNITYPILRCNDVLMGLEQDYVPATYFLKGDGTILTEEPYAGARSYEDWETIIKSYLGE